jgi:hypothetical protein
MSTSKKETKSVKVRKAEMIKKEDLSTAKKNPLKVIIPLKNLKESSIPAFK